MSEVIPYEKKYPKHLIVMQNRILQAYHQMTLDEKRLIIIASAVARVIDATEKDAIEITAEDFAQAVGIKVNSAYKQIEQASRTMMQRQFSYKSADGATVRTQWVIRAKYNNSTVSMCFSDEVLHMLKVFNADNPFTKYDKTEVLKLKRDYSIDLYHIFKKNQHRQPFDIPLDEIRSELGLSKAYDRINNLKNRVIEPAIKEINSKSDITVKYDNVKKGRTVVALKFTVKAKPKPKIKNDNAHDYATNSIKGLSDAQLGRIARSPKFIQDYSHTVSSTSSINQDMTAWANHFIQELKKDPSLYNKRPIRDYLDY